MATFIELVKNARLISGMQGSGPSSVSAAQGIEEVLVRFVRDAYVDIQSLREDFGFLEGTETFSTAAGKDTYTVTDIFGTSTPNFKKYQDCSFIITDASGHKKYLRCQDRNVLEARYLNEDSQKLPTEYAIHPSNKSIILKPIPDGVYSISFRYYEEPEILLTDAQVPKMPLEFHNLILYKAVEKMAVYLSAPELYREYSIEAARMTGQLMRMELPKKRLSARPLA